MTRPALTQALRTALEQAYWNSSERDPNPVQPLLDAILPLIDAELTTLEQRLDIQAKDCIAAIEAAKALTAQRDALSADATLGQQVRAMRDELGDTYTEAGLKVLAARLLDLIDSTPAPDQAPKEPS